MSTFPSASTAIRDWVPMRPCLLITAVLFIPTLVVIYSVNQIGFSQSQYWLVQVDSFVFLNTVFSDQPSFWFNLTQLGDAYLLLPPLSFFLFYKPQIWAAFFGSIPLATLLTHGGKALTAIPRPAAVLETNQINIIGDTLTGNNSLPSGHTATVFVIGTVIMLVLFYSQSRTSRLCILPIVITTICLLAISRVAVGAHWPLDVFFGALCGYLGGVSGIYLTQRYSGWWKWIKQPENWLLIGIVMLVWSASLLPPLHDDNPVSTIAQWTSALVGITFACQLIARHYSSKR